MSSLFREIKRRKMIGTCILYALICWGLLQVAEILSPAVGMEWETASRYFLVATIAGLPVAIVLAWFYQITREGIVRTTAFRERRVLSNIPPINDRRKDSGIGSKQGQGEESFDWIVSAETGPLMGLAYGVAGPLLLGRSLDCDLAIMSPKMSRHHARLDIEEGMLTIEDLGSANGIMVNGHVVVEKQILHHQDVIQFQEVEFRVQESYSRANSKDSFMNQTTLFGEAVDQ